MTKWMAAASVVSINVLSIIMGSRRTQFVKRRVEVGLGLTMIWGRKEDEISEIIASLLRVPPTPAGGPVASHVTGATSNRPPTTSPGARPAGKRALQKCKCKRRGPILFSLLHKCWRKFRRACFCRSRKVGSKAPDHCDQYLQSGRSGRGGGGSRSQVSTHDTRKGDRRNVFWVLLGSLTAVFGISNIHFSVFCTTSNYLHIPGPAGKSWNSSSSFILSRKPCAFRLAARLAWGRNCFSSYCGWFTYSTISGNSHCTFSDLVRLTFSFIFPSVTHLVLLLLFISIHSYLPRHYGFWPTVIIQQVHEFKVRCIVIYLWASRTRSICPPACRHTMAL